MRRVPKKQLAVKPVVSSEFDECTRSENFIEILRFRHFARYMSFTPTGKQGKKNRKDACFQNFWKMSVLFFYSKAKEKIKNGKEERNVFIRESRARCRYCTDETGRAESIASAEQRRSEEHRRRRKPVIRWIWIPHLQS